MDEMNTINTTWYTCENQFSPQTFTLFKKKIKKENERDIKMEKIMTQLYVLSKNVMGLVSEVSMSWGFGVRIRRR